MGCNSAFNNDGLTRLALVHVVKDSCGMPTNPIERDRIRKTEKTTRVVVMTLSASRLPCLFPLFFCNVI